MGWSVHHDGRDEHPVRAARGARPQAATNPCERGVEKRVVGAGAIGGYVGGWLGAADEDVTFIARGANLEAIRRAGMRVIGEDGVERVAPSVAVFDKMRDAGRA